MENCEAKLRDLEAKFEKIKDFLPVCKMESVHKLEIHEAQAEKRFAQLSDNVKSIDDKLIEFKDSIDEKRRIENNLFKLVLVIAIPLFYLIVDLAKNYVHLECTNASQSQTHTIK